MDIYRRLIYKDRTSLNEFGINEDGSLNQLLYEEWLLSRRELRGDDRRILQAFNDAHFLCTMAFVKPDARFDISYAFKNVSAPSVVLPLTRFYLSCIGRLPKGTKMFWNSIPSLMEDDATQNLSVLEKVVGGEKHTLTPDMFASRTITEELLSTVTEAEWQTVTRKYNKERIQQIVALFAKNEDEWRLLCAAIKEAAKTYDYEFQFEDYEQQCFDEESGQPYLETIRVPKQPYDNWGNDIVFEPLKHDGVYEFCDELKEKYENLKSKTPNSGKNVISTSEKGSLSGKKDTTNVPTCPECLCTPKAKKLWAKAQKEGWVDEHWQPKISRTKAAVLAGRIGDLLSIKGWVPFEQLWQRKNIKQDHFRGMGQQSTQVFLDKLKKKLK